MYNSTIHNNTVHINVYLVENWKWVSFETSQKILSGNDLKTMTRLFFKVPCAFHVHYIRFFFIIFLFYKNIYLFIYLHGSNS